MKKSLLLIFLIMFLWAPSVRGEELPPRGVKMNKENYPIHWQYLEDYLQRLNEALEAKRMFRLRGMGAAYKYLLTRDGQIKDMEIDIYQNEYFNKKVKEIILSVEPLPFYQGMDSDIILLSVYLGYEHYNEIEINVGWSLPKNKKIFSLTAITKK